MIYITIFVIIIHHLDKPKVPSPETKSIMVYSKDHYPHISHKYPRLMLPDQNGK